MVRDTVNHCIPWRASIRGRELSSIDPCAVLLTNITRAERDESSQRVSDIEERLHEYEQALDELERDHEAKLSSAALEARRRYEAEHAITLAEFGKCRDNEKLMRQVGQFLNVGGLWQKGLRGSWARC